MAETLRVAKLDDVQSERTPVADPYLAAVGDAHLLVLNRYRDFVAEGKLIEARAALDLAREIFDLSEKRTFPEIETPCDKSPVGQCEYDALRNPERCIHCGRGT